MAIDGVPLWIGGGEADHSAELLRMLNYVIFRGQEGFVTAPQILQLNTPGAGIQILPAPFVINSRFAGGSLQSYMDRIWQAHVVDTTPTSPSNGRSDLVVLNVEDPYPSGGVQWPYPGGSGSDGRRFGPYVHARVIEDVSPATYALRDLPPERTERSWSAIAVARLDRPANSNTVTQSQIKPLAITINPWQGVVLPPEILTNISDMEDSISDVGDQVEGILNQGFPTPATFVDTVYSVNHGPSGAILPTDNSFKQFPEEAQWQVFVPTWATHAEVFCVMTGAYQRATSTAPAHIWGETRIQVGQTYSDVCPFDYDEFYTTNTDPERFGNRPVFVTSGIVPVNSNDCGKKVTVRQQGRMYDDPNTNGRLVADEATNTRIEIHFKESA